MQKPSGPHIFLQPCPKRPTGLPPEMLAQCVVIQVYYRSPLDNTTSRTDTSLWAVQTSLAQPIRCRGTSDTGCSTSCHSNHQQRRQTTNGGIGKDHIFCIFVVVVGKLLQFIRLTKNEHSIQYCIISLSCFISCCYSLNTLNSSLTYLVVYVPSTILATLESYVPIHQSPSVR